MNTLEPDEYIPTLTHATERDIDLLLVEEIKCDFEFVKWIISQLPVKGFRPSRVRVLHSKRRTFERREIDIHVEIVESGDPPTKITLLIENKIDEKEQPGQGISYKEEMELLVRQQRSDHVFSILVCPNAYLLSWPRFVGQFSMTFTYESVETFFRTRSKSQSGELKARLLHRAELIAQGITKQRRGYIPIPIAKIEDFNGQYLNLLNGMTSEIIPGNGLSKRGKKPSDSVSMIFDCRGSFPDFSKEIVPTRFAHELGRGKTHRANYVNVQFRGFDRGFERLNEQEKDKIRTDGIVVEIKMDHRSGKKVLKLLMPTPAVDNQALFSSVKSEVQEGIAAAIKLRQWCIDQRSLLERIAKFSVVRR